MFPWRILLRLTAAVYLTLAAFASTPHPAGYNPAEKTDNCGPPNYCARVDRNIEPYKPAPPALGAAGSIIRDPGFGSRILRVTDAKSDATGAGRSFMTPASAEQNSWNANSTKFFVLTPGGQHILYDFDPSTMQVRQDGVLKVRWGGDPEFSFSKPNILYGMRSQAPAFRQYDTATRQITTISDISDCMKLDSSIQGFSVNVSADDSRMNTVLGPGQDKNFVVYVYDRKLGCRWYNTRTGEIGGQWGPKGTIAASDRYSIHNSRMSKSGQYIWIARGYSRIGKDWLVWDVATMNVTACPAQCSGHHAMGYSTLVGPSGQRHPLELISRRLDDVAKTTRLISQLQPATSMKYWYDQHYSWNYTNSTDTTPVCLSTYSNNNSAIPGAPLDTSAPWENEILCVETGNQNARVWRFAHTYSTGKHGFWSTPRGNVSQDGRFFMFTSDWQGQLGARPSNKEYGRMDVFVVELR